MKKTKTIKAWAVVASDGAIKIFTSYFGAYTIFPSEEQCSALERMFPTDGKIVKILITFSVPSSGGKKKKRNEIT